MTATALPATPMGFGRMARKEDVRFTRGHGTYVDDVQLTGMLHGAILRSPFAHAKIVSIDTKAAEAHPKVKAVITGAVLETLGLAWMPTLSYDTQAVLATDKVRFQGQEVAFVIAEDRYSARDALELIDVEYEELPVVFDARKAMDADAPVIRDDKEGKTDNLIFDWESGDRAKTDEVFANADVVVSQDILYPRVHPAPLETCGAIADMDPITGKLTLWCNTQAPHAHRTVYALVAGLPEHKIRIISPDIGGGFGNKVPVYPGYVCAIVGSIVTGKPVKWVEDRSENLMSTGFARDYHMHAEIAVHQRRQDPGDTRGRARRPWRVQRRLPSRRSIRPDSSHVFSGSYDLEAAHCDVKGIYTNKAPGGVAYACSFRVTEAAYVIERMVDLLAQELQMDPAELRLRNLLRPEQFPYDSSDRLAVRLRRLREDAAARARHGRVRRVARRAGGAAGEVRGGREAPDAHRHRHQLLHRGGRRRPAQAHGHPRSRHGRRCRASCPPDRQGGAGDLRTVPGAGARDHVRADRGGGVGHLAGRCRGRARRHGSDPVRPRHVRLAVDTGLRRRDGRRRAKGPRPREDRRLGHAGGLGRRPGVGEGTLVCRR